MPVQVTGRRIRYQGRLVRLATVQDTVEAHLQASATSVQKMERRVDLYILALREALHAIGGELEIVVRLPGRAPVPLTGFEGLLGSSRS